MFTVEKQSNGETCSAHFPFITESGLLAHGLVPPTLRVALAIGVNLTYIGRHRQA